MLMDAVCADRGSLGVSTKGKSVGKFVFVYPEIFEDSWVILLEPPYKAFYFDRERFGMYNLVYTEQAEELLNQWGVVWVSGDVEPVLEKRFFDCRADLTMDEDDSAWWKRKND
ncbi:hypothetical protein [Timonella sp. A28]|uniref:hypothetical protein n=1 Tax=Timonella sp. A28 TaxID=3442640 RepID=UPI003EB9DF11